MINPTDNKSFGLGLTDVNEVCKCIVYMTHDIIVFVYICLYDIVYDI